LYVFIIKPHQEKWWGYVPLYKAVTSTDAMSSRTAKMSEPVSALESRNSAKLRDIIIMQWNKVEQEGVHILICPRNIPMSVAPY